MPKITPKDHLEPSDLSAMMIADLDARLAEAIAERNHARIALERFSAEQRMRSMQAQIEEDALTLMGKQEARRRLVEELAVRYAIDWKTTAFDPLTGKLQPLPSKGE